MEKKQRAHAATIIEWANGAKIEYRHKQSGEWVPTDHPAFVEDYEYRVKPEDRYSDTIMTHPQMYRAFYEGADLAENERFINLINAGLRDAIDNGQVVTREEFGRAIGDRAARDLAVSMAVRDKCRDLTVKHAMRSGVVHDIERLDLFAIIDAVNG